MEARDDRREAAGGARLQQSANGKLLVANGKRAAQAPGARGYRQQSMCTLVLSSGSSLLNDPNPASPANSEASRLYSEHRREYDRRVREVVEQSWQDEPGEAPDDGGDEDDSDAMNDDD